MISELWPAPERRAVNLPTLPMTRQDPKLSVLLTLRKEERRKRRVGVQRTGNALRGSGNAPERPLFSLENDSFKLFLKSKPMVLKKPNLQPAGADPAAACKPRA